MPPPSPSRCLPFLRSPCAPTRSAAEIQAEIDRLTAELEAQKQALAAANAAPTDSATIASVAVTTDAPHDTALGKVTVRARNRLEPLQEVPLSISVVTGKELDRLQATEIGAITQRAANVSWNLGNQRTSSLSIRGVGRQGQTEAQDPSVGFIVDGVSYGYNALTSSFDFIDVDTVEVTRGPQGTLLGKNASLGVVSVNTRRPSFTPDANLSVTYGDWDTVIVRGAGGGPIIDGKLAWRGRSTPTRARATSRTNTTAISPGPTRIASTAACSCCSRRRTTSAPDCQSMRRRAVARPPTDALSTRRRLRVYSNGAANTLATDARPVSRGPGSRSRRATPTRTTICTAAATTKSTTTTRGRL